MIQYNLLNEIPHNRFNNPRLFNGNYFIVFDDDDEFDDYIKSSVTVWNKESNIATINQLHNELFDRILEQHNYLSIAELNIWGQNPESEYYNEAISILNWFTSTCVLIEQYASTVTEVNYQEPEAFIASLPSLN